MEQNYFKTSVQLTGEQETVMNTDITIRPYAGENQPQVRAFASLLFNGCLMCDNIRIVEENGRFYVSMPRRRLRADEYRDICRPVNRDFRNQLYSAIIDAYRQATPEQAEE